jgi:hypothetical protein
LEETEPGSYRLITDSLTGMTRAPSNGWENGSEVALGSSPLVLETNTGAGPGA